MTTDDPARQTTTPAHYVEIPWGLELFEAISKRPAPLDAPDANLPKGLPSVLACSIFPQLKF